MDRGLDIDFKSCEDFLKDLDYNKLNKYYIPRYHRRVFVTKNMHLLLHCLLTSMNINNDNPEFKPSEEVKEILKNFNNLDIVDTYSRLGINKGYFSDYIVNESKKYTLKKYLYAKENRDDDE
jgi:hypothetical protein